MMIGLVNRIFLLSFLTFFMVSCEHETIEPRKKDSDCHLKSEIITWPQGFADSTFYYYNEQGLESEIRTYSHSVEIVYITKKYYDQKDHLIREERFYSDEFKGKTIFQYDGQGNIIFEIGVSADGFAYEETQSTYGKHGITSQISRYPSGSGVSIYTEQWAYDNYGRVNKHEDIRIGSYEDDQYDGISYKLRKDFTFNNNDEILSCNIYTAKAKSGPLSDTLRTGREHYKYDAQKNMTSFIWEDFPNAYMNETKWDYDSEGREIFYENSTHSDSFIRKYDYVYDDHGHLIEFKYQTHYMGPLVHSYKYSCSD